VILRLRSLPRMAIAAIISGAAAVFVVVGALLTTNHLLPYNGQPQLALVSTRSGQAELYLLDINHAVQRQLTSSIGYVRQPAWSPDGTRIAFVAGYDRSDIFVMNADGTGLSNLTASTPDFVADNPAWSPDGTRLAFTLMSVTGGAANIYVMDVLTAPDSAWTYTPEWKAQPVWSPDGRYIAYGVSTSNWDIWLLDAASGQTWPLADSPFDDQSPAWSPDGRLAYVSWVDSALSAEIFVMDIAAGADGQVRGWNQRRLTDNTAMDSQPSWSPDGSQIAFVSNRDNGYFDVYTMNTNGDAGSVRRLTYSDGPETSPQWSPDGSQLVFTLDRRYTGRFVATGSCGVFAADVGRGLIRELTGSLDGICDTFPIWRP